jgi:nucleoside-diphosphate-sugar epimerase
VRSSHNVERRITDNSGDGEQSLRDFTYVANVVRGNLLACQAQGVAGKVYNIACGRSVTLNQVVSNLNNLLGTASGNLYFSPSWDIQHCLPIFPELPMTFSIHPVDLRPG